MRLIHAVLSALALLVPHAAIADNIPSHGAVIHLDPFPPFPSPGAPLVGPGWGPPPNTELIPPFALGAPWVGADGLVSPAFWHWESEIDIGPAFSATPLGPAVVPTFFFGFGPFPVFYGPGPDIYIDVHQLDLGGSLPFLGVCGIGFAEVGPVCKQLLNLTPLFVAWGTSVTEDRAGDGVAGKDVSFFLASGEMQTMSFPISDTAHNALRVSFDGTHVLFEEINVPEPATIALLGLGLLGYARRRRRHHPAQWAE